MKRNYIDLLEHVLVEHTLWVSIMIMIPIPFTEHGQVFPIFDRVTGIKYNAAAETVVTKS